MFRKMDNKINVVFTLVVLLVGYLAFEMPGLMIAAIVMLLRGDKRKE